MSEPTGTIKTDINGVPYLSQIPAGNILHIAFQNINKEDIGSPYTILYATNERHMVNGINHLYGTNFTWAELENIPHEFFNGAVANPLTRLKFSKVVNYYIAEVIEISTLDLDIARPASEINEMLVVGGTVPSTSSVYYAQGDDIAILKSFMNTNYSTNKVSFNPSRDIDSTQMVLSDNEFLTTVVIRNYHNNGGYSTLLFKNDVKPAIDLNMSTFTKDRALKVLSHHAGIILTDNNFVGSDQIRAFDPISGLDQTYTLFELIKAGRKRYMATVNQVVTEEPVLTLPGPML